MIAKQIKGRGFYGCLRYVLTKPGARVLDANVAVGNLACLTRQFEMYCQTNPRVRRVVYHAILSTRASEALDDLTWTSIANEYLELMEFTGVPYVIVKHGDTAHDHVHIVAGRVGKNGKRVDDSWDYPRSEIAVRRIEARYGLSTPTTWRDIHADTVIGQKRAPWRLPLPEPRPEEERAMAFIRESIDLSILTDTTLVELIRSLSRRGIGVILHATATGKIGGLKFVHGGRIFAGTRLGEGYTWNGLTRKRGLAYGEADREELETLTAGQDINRGYRGRGILNRIAALAADLPGRDGDNSLDLGPYRLELSEGRLILTRLSDGTVLLTARHAAGCRWVPTEETGLLEDDIEFFENFRESRPEVSDYPRGKKR